MITAAFYRETEGQEPGSLKRRARGGCGVLPKVLYSIPFKVLFFLHKMPFLCHCIFLCLL